MLQENIQHVKMCEMSTRDSIKELIRIDDELPRRANKKQSTSNLRAILLTVISLIITV